MVRKTVTTAPAPDSHALLGASSSHRWLHCPPSARLCADLPDTDSPYAREGSLAHELAALCLQQIYQSPRTKAAYASARARILNALGYAAEATECGGTVAPDEAAQIRARSAASSAADAAVGAYLDLIQDDCSLIYTNKPMVLIEQRVDYSRFAPEGFGTCDCITFGQDKSGQWWMRVYDYKHGKGVPVTAERNSQLLLYALGALDAFSLIYPIDMIALTICQPRRDNITSWQITPEELLAWGESIRPIAAQAYAGEGEFCEGDWCQFCGAKDRCRTRAERFTALEDFGYRTPADPRDPLTDAELSDVLTVGERLDKWLDQLRKYVQDLLLAGGTVPGWKLVEGRAVRAFVDPVQAFELAKAAGVKEELLYVREPITLTALESLMGKKPFAEALATQITRKPGKPALVPEADPRPAITKATAEADFAPEAGQ